MTDPAWWAAALVALCGSAGVLLALALARLPAAADPHGTCPPGHGCRGTDAQEEGLP